jgi:hypothetical protein
MPGDPNECREHAKRCWALVAEITNLQQIVWVCGVTMGRPTMASAGTTGRTAFQNGSGVTLRARIL